MKSIKKFSAMTAKDQPITESAKVTKEAVDELIKKIGFDSIEELKKEKDLLSKLEAMSKTIAKSNDISEDEIEEDRAEDIEDEMKAKGKAKSLEGTEDKEGDAEVVDSDSEVAEDDEVKELSGKAKEIEDEVNSIGSTKSLEDKEGEEVSDEQEITAEVPAEADEVEDEDGVDVASEEEETPKATRRIMAFEDFIKEKEETINKNISYHDDDEEPEDYAVPVAASADPLAEAKVNEDDEEEGKDDEKKGDELEDKGDKKVDSEDDKEKADHYKGAVKSDDKQIDALKKDVEYDKEEEEDAEKNESKIMSFSTFVNEAYDRVVFGGNKDDKSKTHDGEDFEDDDEDDKKEESANEKYDDVVLGGNKGDKSKTHDGEDFEDDDEKDESANEKYDDVVLGGNKGDKSKTHDGEDFEDDDEKDESVEEGVGEVITKVEGDEIADEEAGDDGIAIPAIKGDGPETAAGIAGDMMDMGKPKSVEGKGKELITPDQKVTEVIPDSPNDVSTDGIEIPLVKEEEEVLADDSIAEKFRKLANNKLGKVNEAEIKSADQFKEYAMKMLKDAFGDDFDETKATETADGLIDKYGEDYGAMVGALQSTMGS